jgi:ribosome-binding factor A
VAGNRLERVNELLKREIADTLFREMTGEDFNPAAVTVTRVITSSDLHHARVFVSIRGEEDRRRDLMRLLQKHRVAFQQRINRDVRIKYTPQLIFEEDPSIERGAHVLSVIEKLEQEHPEWGEEEPREPSPS